MEFILADLKQKLDKTLEVIKNDLSTIRTGRAAPSILENLVIAVYGGSAKLKIMEVASIQAPDTATLVLTPFDQSVIGEIRQGILAANIGLNPVIDGNLIRIALPPLSEERRKELIKVVGQRVEGGRVMIRQIRQKTMEAIKETAENEDEEKRLIKELQAEIDKAIEEIDKLQEKKEAELIQV